MSLNLARRKFALELKRRQLTPPMLAHLSGVGIDKILGWIRCGALKASNLATKPGCRPRWFVDIADWEQFLQSRSNQINASSPAPKQHRRQGSDYTHFQY
jgi:hypothetical protein